MPSPYEMKRGFFCMGFSRSPIILVSSGQFSILWFIYSGIDEPFPQHFPALTGLCCTLSLVNCTVSSVWTLVSTKGWLEHLWHPHAFSQALCYWVSLALCACHQKWHLLPHGNSPCSWNMGWVFALDQLPLQSLGGKRYFIYMSLF